MLILNTGSSNLHVQTVTTRLYIESQFVGDATWSTGTAFALFVGSTSGYLGIFPSTSVSNTLLESLFSGHSVGTLVIEPDFNDPAGSVMFSGWFLHAGTTKPADPVTRSWEDIYPSARMLSETVLTVAEPNSG